MPSSLTLLMEMPNYPQLAVPLTIVDHLLLALLVANLSWKLRILIARSRAETTYVYYFTKLYVNCYNNNYEHKYCSPSYHVIIIVGWQTFILCTNNTKEKGRTRGSRSSRSSSRCGSIMQFKSDACRCYLRNR